MKETTKRLRIKPIFAILSLSLLVGCATAPKNVPPPFDSIMSQAEAKVSASDTEGAIKTFEEAARVDPTRKEPWVRIAQLQFDRGNYARAIIAAEETLQRAPDDLVADGVMTVSGFRLANYSLMRLQKRGIFTSTTARQEAKTLAAAMQSILNDKPQQALQSEASKQKRKPRPATTAPDGTAQPASVRASESPGSDGDPFKNIGGK